MTDGGLGTAEESRFDGMPPRGRLRMPQERHPKARQTGPSEPGCFALVKTVQTGEFRNVPSGEAQHRQKSEDAPRSR